MSLVKLHATGVANRSEALNIGGVEPRSCHPITRYVENPFNRLAAAHSSRDILQPRTARQLGKLSGTLEYPSLANQHYFRDLWAGYSHTVYAIVSRPMPHPQISCLSRLAMVTHLLMGEQANATEDDVVDEVLLQHTDGNNWLTVAAIAKHADTKQEFGFVKPEVLEDGVVANERLVRIEGNAFLNRLVEVVADALEESTARAVF